MSELIDLKEIIDGAELQTRVVRLNTPSHGSSHGEAYEQTQYYDVLFYEWVANKDRAIESYVLSVLRGKIKKCLSH